MEQQPAVLCGTEERRDVSRAGAGALRRRLEQLQVSWQAGRERLLQVWGGCDGG